MASAPDAPSAPGQGCVVVTGAAGYLGTLTVQALLVDRAAGRIVGVDRVRGPLPIAWQPGDLCDPAVVASIPWPAVDAVVHLAALTTMPAEQDFDAARRLNVDASLALLDACRAEAARRGRPLRFVFASSVGVFAGGEARVDEASAAAPASTYGFTKVVVERYLAEFCRRGFVDGVTIRLPVCMVRPGRTLRTSAGFLSDLVCRLAAGGRFVLPMPPGWTIPVASSEAAGGLLAAMAVRPGDRLPVRMLHLPALPVCALDVIAALRNCGIAVGPDRFEVAVDDDVMRVTAGWPTHFDSRHPELTAALPGRTLQQIVARHLASSAGRAAVQH
jgi:D-erythronate 2-dehydrogenase